MGRQPKVAMRPKGMTTIAWLLMERSRSLHAVRHPETSWEDCHFLPCHGDRAALATPEAVAPDGYKYTGEPR